MMSKRIRAASIPVVVAPAVAFNGILLLFVAPDRGVGWISLAVLNLAYVAMILAFKLAPKEAGNVFGYQLTYIAWLFFVFELVVTFVILTISSLEHWLSKEGRVFVALNLLITAAFVVLYVGTLVAQRHSAAQLSLQDQNLQFPRTAANQLERIRSLSSDPEVKTEVRKVDDAIRYSPTKWDFRAQTIEEEILDKLTQVQECLRSEDTSSALVSLEEIKRLADDRSALLRSTK